MQVQWEWTNQWKTSFDFGKILWEGEDENAKGTKWLKSLKHINNTCRIIAVFCKYSIYMIKSYPRECHYLLGASFNQPRFNVLLVIMMCCDPF